MLGKRVFTKRLDPQPVTIAATGHFEELNAAIWTVQEDITIIGMVAAFVCSAKAENDGQDECQFEISQGGDFDMDGCLAHVHLAAVWNTTPAAVTLPHAELDFMLPSGYGVPVKEGGSIYAHYAGWQLSAGTTIWNMKAYIYYVKGIA